jgi:hypothetical protein
MKGKNWKACKDGLDRTDWFRIIQPTRIEDLRWNARHDASRRLFLRVSPRILPFFLFESQSQRKFPRFRRQLLPALSSFSEEATKFA